jgi:selenocysteine-specific translation elongation factor
MILPIELNEVAKIRSDLENMSSHSTERLFELLSNSKNRVLTSAIFQTLHIAQKEFPGFPVLYFGSVCDAVKHHHPHAKALMYVLDIFGVEDKGTWATGYISRGEINPGDELVLLKADGRELTTRCLEMNKHPSQSAMLQLENLSMGEVCQGDCLVKLAL